MKLPKFPHELVLARDAYGTKIVLHANSEGGHDLSTDGRVLLSPSVARELAKRLLEFADGSPADKENVRRGMRMLREIIRDVPPQPPAKNSVVAPGQLSHNEHEDG